LNILIVDDSRLLRLSNERALVKAGHHVVAAEDGEQGLRLALEQKPDLVVLDMMLPNDVAKIVRARGIARSASGSRHRIDPGPGLKRPSTVQRKQTD